MYWELQRPVRYEFISGKGGSVMPLLLPYGTSVMELLESANADAVQATSLALSEQRSSEEFQNFEKLKEELIATEKGLETLRMERARLKSRQRTQISSGSKDELAGIERGIAECQGQIAQQEQHRQVVGALLEESQAKAKKEIMFIVLRAQQLTQQILTQEADELANRYLDVAVPILVELVRKERARALVDFREAHLEALLRDRLKLNGRSSEVLEVSPTSQNECVAIAHSSEQMDAVLGVA